MLVELEPVRKNTEEKEEDLRQKVRKHLQSKQIKTYRKAKEQEGTKNARRKEDLTSHRRHQVVRRKTKCNA